MDVRFPIGQLQVPDNITTTDISQWLEEINNYADQLKQVVSHLNEHELQQTYREGAWTVRQLVHHIADSQINMYQRLKLALTDDGVTVPEFNQELWVDLPDNEAPIEESIHLLAALNARIVALGRGLTEKDLTKSFKLQGTDVVTVGETIAKLSWHEKHHLAHIQIALDKQVTVEQ